jgi:hypothetical protein
MKFLDGTGVRDRIRNVNATGLGMVFDEHYGRHPLTKLDKKHQPVSSGQAAEGVAKPTD